MLTELVARARVVRYGPRQYGPPIRGPYIPRSLGQRFPYCDEAYNNNHIRTHGYTCLNRHREYNWPPLRQEKYLLVGDSIIKRINRSKHLRVQAFPGATSYSLYNKVWSGDIEPQEFSMIIVSVATNDLCEKDKSPSEIANSIRYLFHTLRVFNPCAVLVYSAMVVRPKDIGGPLEQRRKVVNSIVQHHCRYQNVIYLKSWKCLLYRGNIKPRVYAKDNLHLSATGSRTLYRFIEGNIRTIEGLMKL
jgi:lysophospholipase L1-like esterase